MVFVGDAGATEINDGTKRLGIEGDLFWQATPWRSECCVYGHRLEIQTGSRGREIPGAVRSTFSLRITAWPNGFSSSLRIRWPDEAPLIEDNSVRSDASLLINAGVMYGAAPPNGGWRSLNLANSKDDDIAYFYASRLPGEIAEGVEDVHFHPLEPRSVRATFTALVTAGCTDLASERWSGRVNVCVKGEDR